jgi:hypothetical protein
MKTTSFLGVSFCIMATNVFGECRCKSVNYKNEENYLKKLKPKNWEQKSWFCDVIKVTIGYHGN